MITLLRMFSLVFGTTFLLCNTLACSSGKAANGKSENIQESKRRGVFIQELTIDPEILFVNDENRLRVKSVFLERYWKSYSLRKNETQFEPYMGQFQILIIFEDSLSLEGSSPFNWDITSGNDLVLVSIDHTMKRFVVHLDHQIDDPLDFTFRRFAWENGERKIVEEKELFSILPK